MIEPELVCVAYDKRRISFCSRPPFIVWPIYSNAIHWPILMNQNTMKMLKIETKDDHLYTLISIMNERYRGSSILPRLKNHSEITVSTWKGHEGP